MKKVLYVATVDLHIRSFHLQYLKMLKDMGYEVHVATNGKEQLPYCDKKHTICIERSPFKLKNIMAVKQLKKIIDNENYEIIHCHTPMGSVVTRLAAKKARKKGTKVIYTAHGFHFYKGAPILNWILFYPIEKNLSKYTDTIITINKEDYEFAKRKFKKTVIEYIPGIGLEHQKFDIELTEEEKKEARKKLGLKANDFVLIYPARLDKNKNQILIIDAMEEIVKKNDNIHLLLPGKDELNNYYQNIVNEKKLNKNIHFLGHRDDIPRLLKISDVSIAVSIREGFGLNLVEALYSGIPVIATNNRGHKDIIENGINGFLINFNKFDIIEKVLLISDGYKFSDIKGSANKFLLENSINMTKKIYLSNIKNKKG